MGIFPPVWPMGISTLCKLQIVTLFYCHFWIVLIKPPCMVLQYCNIGLRRWRKNHEILRAFFQHRKVLYTSSPRLEISTQSHLLLHHGATSMYLQMVFLYKGKCNDKCNDKSDNEQKIPFLILNFLCWKFHSQTIFLSRWGH